MKKMIYYEGISVCSWLPKPPLIKMGFCRNESMCRNPRAGGSKFRTHLSVLMSKSDWRPVSQIPKHESMPFCSTDITEHSVRKQLLRDSHSLGAITGAETFQHA
jgi:hypothetical protein